MRSDLDAHQRLTGFPDVEGIETSGQHRLRASSRLTGFPDVEGIETSRPAVLVGRHGHESDRLP